MFAMRFVSNMNDLFLLRSDLVFVFRKFKMLAEILVIFKSPVKIDGAFICKVQEMSSMTKEQDVVKTKSFRLDSKFGLNSVAP